MIKNRVQTVSIFLICLVLFQSCRVYHRENVSLDKAVTEQKRVKIKTIDGQKMKFKKIVLDNRQYFGIEKIKGDDVRILIDPNTIQSVRLHNKTMSIIYGIGVGIVAGIVSVTILFIAAWDGIGFAIAPIGAW
ncbi:hypothetical protein [Winogradskyella sp. PE311]|uniref:hypothetical protein n=1 Tax=Winogradskyella sp. PE311 TaxID=3366943 RepID=UPI00397EF4BF